MACDANTLMAAAAANGYEGLSDRGLKMCILELLCSGGGGGGGGIGAVYHYTGASPTADGIVPTTAAVAYKIDGTGPTYVWDTANSTWV